MSCSRAASFVHDAGGILLRKDYGFADFSVYDSNTGHKWGRRGVPSDVKKEGKKHQVKTISLITTVEEARDALANGYAISVCSDVGFSSRRDSNGYAKRHGSWGHAMAWVACNDTKKKGGPGFLIQNSWGHWNNGPKQFGQPDGSFWIDYSVARRMLGQRGSWVFSDVDGFPPRKLPDYGGSLWG
jgi:C1A family cysteine protease